MLDKPRAHAALCGTWEVVFMAQLSVLRLPSLNLGKFLLCSTKASGVGCFHMLHAADWRWIM